MGLIPLFLAWGEHSCVTAWGGDTCAEGCIGVPAPFASLMILPENVGVTVTRVAAEPIASAVFVQAETEDDWEMISAFASAIEAQLMTQVRVVRPGQRVLVHAHATALALSVAAVVPPAPHVVLGPATEIIVAPPRLGPANAPGPEEPAASAPKAALAASRANPSASSSSSAAPQTPEPEPREAIAAVTRVSAFPGSGESGSFAGQWGLLVPHPVALAAGLRDGDSAVFVPAGSKGHPAILRSVGEPPASQCLDGVQPPDRDIGSQGAPRGQQQTQQQAQPLQQQQLQQQLQQQGEDALEAGLGAPKTDPVSSSSADGGFSSRKEDKVRSALEAIGSWTGRAAIGRVAVSTAPHPQRQARCTPAFAASLSEGPGSLCSVRLLTRDLTGLAGLATAPAAVFTLVAGSMPSAVVGSGGDFVCASCRTRVAAAVRDALPGPGEQPVFFASGQVASLRVASSRPGCCTMGDDETVHTFVATAVDPGSASAAGARSLPVGILAHDTVFAVATRPRARPRVAAPSPSPLHAASWEHAAQLLAEASGSLAIHPGLAPLRASLKSLSRCGGVALGGLRIMLLTGGTGHGKSTALGALGSEMMLQGAHVCTVSSQDIEKAAAEGAGEVLARVLARAARNSPSVVLWDDADLVLALGSGQENPGEASPATWRARALLEVLETASASLGAAPVIDPRHGPDHALSAGIVSLVLTVKDETSLIPELRASPLVRMRVNLVAPGRKERKMIMGSCGLAGCRDEDLEAAAAVTEGYCPRDLARLCEKARSMAASWEARHPEAGPQRGGPGAFLAGAQESFVPLHALTVKSKGPRALGWDEIGGLHAAKAALREALEWPTRYARLYSQVSLRPRSNTLLYGYPGCGKTMLALAVARQANLSLVQVKGPELLNKYIGASEAAVRDVFARARAARPCMVFFDEFESVAVRRGHDSTGVTDRVVNQLLTQLDGVESLEGVCIVAATSRPDLIDPALLRPGRLDRAVLVGVPTAAEREEIFERVLQRSLCAPDVDCRELAARSQGLTGADIAGLVAGAHLAVVHELLHTPAARPAAAQATHVPQARGGEGVDAGGSGHVVHVVQAGTGDAELAVAEANKWITEQAASPFVTSTKGRAGETTGGESKDPGVVLTQAALLAALAECESALGPKERAKFRAIFDKFAGDDAFTPEVVGTRQALR